MGQERRRGTWGWKRWAVIGTAVGVVLLVGGPYVYIHFIQGPAPAPLTLSPSPGSSSGGGVDGSATADGTWQVGGDSVVGYRIGETIFGQSNVAVGRTSEVTGSVTIDGTDVTAGSFTADMASVRSDESRRDDQFNGRIMETSTFPTATFELTEPIALSEIPNDGARQTYVASGKLTLHGVTKNVTFDVQAQRTGSSFAVAGSIPVVFADYGIGNPSFGPVTTEDNGVLEFSLVFAKS